MVLFLTSVSLATLYNFSIRLLGDPLYDRSCQVGACSFTPVSCRAGDEQRSGFIETIVVLASFALLALAAKDIGKSSARFGLPLISGFLLAGLLTGPYVLGLLDAAAVARLRFIDAFALACIAFAAGGELELATLRGMLHSIMAIILNQACVVLGLGTLAYLGAGAFYPVYTGDVGACGLRCGAAWRHDYGGALAVVSVCHHQGAPRPRTLHANYPWGYGPHGCRGYCRIYHQCVACSFAG